MHEFDIKISNELQKTNQKRMRIFLLILLLVDVGFFLINLKAVDLYGNQNPEVFFSLGLISIFCGIIVLLLNERTTQRRTVVNQLFLLYITGSRLIGIIGYQSDVMAIIPYVAFYLIIASIMYLGREMVVSVVIMQPLLCLILVYHGMERGKLISIMLISTLLVLLACQISYSNRATYTRLVRDERELVDRKALLDGMLSRIDILVMLVKLDGTIKYINQAFEKITGLKAFDYSFSYLRSHFSEESLTPIIKAFDHVVKHEKPFLIENQIVHGKDGREFRMKITMDYIQLNEESYVMLAGTDLTRETNLMRVKDIVIRLNNMLSEYHSLEEYFDDILKSLIEAIPYVSLGSVLLADENGIMTMKANFGYDKPKAERFKLPLEESFFYRNCGNNMKRPLIVNNLVTYSMDGVADILGNIYGLGVLSSISSPIIIDGKFQGLLNLDSFQNNVFGEEDLEIMQFLTEQISIVLTSHQLLNRTIYLSRYDQLTGLFNRWQLKEFESEKLPYFVRYNERFCFVMMDLNNLKKINDKYGHLLGDVYLAEFSDLLRLGSRESDILMRIGGDEFAGVYPVSEQASLSAKFDQMNRRLKIIMKDRGIAEGDFGFCGFAYGIAMFPEESVQVPELMKIADQKMYEMKKEMKTIHSGTLIF